MHQHDVGNFNAAHQERQKPQPRGQHLGGKGRLIGIVAQHHVAECDGVRREDRDRGAAAHDEIETGCRLDLGLDGIARIVARDQR